MKASTIHKNMETLTILILLALILAFGITLGYQCGSNKLGRQTDHTNPLPDSKFRIIYSDRDSTVIEELGINNTRYLVATVVFGGLEIKPGDIIRKARRGEKGILGLPIHGYPPLIKEFT